MTPRQRIGSTVYALVAEQLANPKNPTIILSHDGILKSDITCSTPKNQLVIWGAGFHPNEDVTISAVTPNGSSSAIFMATADSNGTFMKQGSSTSPAITCNVAGPLTVTAIGNQGSVSSRPVLIAATPTPGPTATPSPTATPIATTPTPVPTTIINSQILTSTTTWTLSGSPYLVKGNVRVDKDVTLTIEPGVDIRFVDNAGLEILGTLRAIGTATNTISFLPSSRRWGGIEFRDSSTDYGAGVGSILERTEILGGFNYSAVQIVSSSPRIALNHFDIISAGPHFAIQIINGSPVLVDNTIECYRCSSGSIGVSYSSIASSTLVISDNRIVSRERGFGVWLYCSSVGPRVIEIQRNIITGTTGSTYGVNVQGCSETSIIQNVIKGWDVAGIRIHANSGLFGSSTRFELERNTMENNGVGISIENVSGIGKSLSSNNLAGNSEYAVQLSSVPSTATIRIEDSYWGTTDPTAISDMIFDNLDDFNLGTVKVVNPVPLKIDISK